MVTPLPSLQGFASLNSQSAPAEVRAAVVAVIKDLRSTVENTSDTAKSRKSIADLLDFLNGLHAKVHPGRVELAQSISQEIIPLLYSKKKTKKIEIDNYKHLQAESMLITYLSNQFGDVLAYVRGELPSHPGFRKGRRKELIPSICLLDSAYASGLRDLINLLLIARFRVKKIEKNIYEPLKNEYLNKGKNAASFFEHKHSYLTEQFHNLFAWLSEVETRLFYNRSGSSGANDEEYSNEENLVLELLDKLKKHSEDCGYFLPRAAGFKLIARLYGLDRKRFHSGVKTLRDATKYGEDHNYVVRQVDKLIHEIEGIDFDMIALSAHMIGDKESCLTYRALQDACIGSARSRPAMMEARPLISAELGRQPIHLAKMITITAEKNTGDLQEFEVMLDLFQQNLKEINKLRFEQEIKSCTGIFLGSDMMAPLAKWLSDEGADGGTSFLRVQQVLTAVQKKWDSHQSPPDTIQVQNG